jgi:hypothetical protein
MTLSIIDPFLFSDAAVPGLASRGLTPLSLDRHPAHHST